MGKYVHVCENRRHVYNLLCYFAHFVAVVDRCLSGTNSRRQQQSVAVGSKSFFLKSSEKFLQENVQQRAFNYTKNCLVWSPSVLDLN